MTKDEALIFVKRDTNRDTFNQLSWGTKVAISVLSDTIAEQDTTIAQLQLDNAKLRDFIDKAFEAHTNLDLDIEALGEAK